MTEPSPIVAPQTAPAAEPSSPSTDPVEAAIKAASGQQSATPAPTPAAKVDGTEPKPEESASEPQERVARRAAKAAQAQRRALEEQRRAREAHQEAVRLREEAQQQLKAQEAFQRARNNPSEFLRLANEYGLNIDDIAKAYLTGPNEPKPDPAEQALAEIRALKEAQEQERKTLAEERAKLERQRFRSDNLQKIAQVIQNTEGDAFEAIKDNRSERLYNHILDRCLQTLREHDYPNPTPEEEVLLINHVAEQVEAELVANAEQSFNRIRNLKKLQAKLGILSPTNNSPSSDGERRHETVATKLDPEAHKILESALNSENKATLRRQAKFITNDSTIASPATSVANSSDDLVAEIMKRYS